jgi:hypothetical protein
MNIIEIAPLENGAHRNQNSGLSVVPSGWAVIPDNMECENFPFGEVEATEINGVMTVTKWTPGEIPEVPVDNSAKIAELKAELESTDYKIIKCYESQLVGEELPYDVVALHAERQSLRDKINELEAI